MRPHETIFFMRCNVFMFADILVSHGSCYEVLAWASKQWKNKASNRGRVQAWWRANMDGIRTANEGLSSCCLGSSLLTENVFFSLRNIRRSEFLMRSERKEEWKNTDGKIITGNTDGNCVDYMYFEDPWSQRNEWVKHKQAVILHWTDGFSIKDNIKHATVLNLRSIPFILSGQTWDAFKL